MKVFRQGDDLAVHIPHGIVRNLELKEGDEVDVVITKRRGSDPATDRDLMAHALERMHALSKPLPPGWKFDRDEANARHPRSDLDPFRKEG